MKYNYSCHLHPWTLSESFLCSDKITHTHNTQDFLRILRCCTFGVFSLQVVNALDFRGLYLDGHSTGSENICLSAFGDPLWITAFELVSQDLETGIVWPKSPGIWNNTWWHLSLQDFHHFSKSFKDSGFPDTSQYFTVTICFL